MMLHSVQLLFVEFQQRNHRWWSSSLNGTDPSEITIRLWTVKTQSLHKLMKKKNSKLISGTVQENSGHQTSGNAESSQQWMGWKHFLFLSNNTTFTLLRKKKCPIAMLAAANYVRSEKPMSFTRHFTFTARIDWNLGICLYIRNQQLDLWQMNFKELTQRVSTAKAPEEAIVSAGKPTC